VANLKFRIPGCGTIPGDTRKTWKVFITVCPDPESFCYLVRHSGARVPCKVSNGLINLPDA